MIIHSHMYLMVCLIAIFTWTHQGKVRKIMKNSCTAAMCTFLLQAYLNCEAFIQKHAYVDVVKSTL